MKLKLNKILLIDDSEADTFIHGRVIKKAGLANDIIVKNSAAAALDYLRTKVGDDAYPNPELVFLDINMPGMNGWDFLQAYDTLMPEQKAGVIVCMLTTSVSETDSQMAKSLPQIRSFLNKPLTEQMLVSIVQQHFGEAA